MPLTVILGFLAAYRPFLDPLPLDTFWMMLMPPMVIAVCIVYKTIKLDDLALVPRQSIVLAAQIITFMVLAAAALWIITELA